MTGFFFNDNRRYKIVKTELTPSLPRLVKFLGWKVIIYTPANSVFDGPMTNLLSILRILTEVLSHAHAKRGKGLINFKFGTFIDRFPSDAATSMAVKGLTKRFLSLMIDGGKNGFMTEHFGSSPSLQQTTVCVKRRERKISCTTHCRMARCCRMARFCIHNPHFWSRAHNRLHAHPVASTWMPTVYNTLCSEIQEKKIMGLLAVFFLL